MKLSEIKGEEALDVLADLIEPVAMMLTDDEIQKIYQNAQLQKKTHVLWLLTR